MWLALKSNIWAKSEQNHSKITKIWGYSPGNQLPFRWYGMEFQIFKCFGTLRAQFLRFQHFVSTHRLISITKNPGEKRELHRNPKLLIRALRCLVLPARLHSEWRILAPYLRCWHMACNVRHVINITSSILAQRLWKSKGNEKATLLRVGYVSPEYY